MRTKTTIAQFASTTEPDPSFSDKPMTWISTPNSPTDVHALVRDREALRTDDEASTISFSHAWRVFGEVHYASRSAYRKAVYGACKRGIDIAGALFLLLLTLPLCIMVAILIKVTSPGPVLFRHKRLGKGGKEFTCFKFRTMVTDAEKQLRRNEHLRRHFEGNYKIKDDPRVTPLGDFLRKTSIDELPQLLQVLKGDMSLIGPRPIVEHELSKYAIYANKLLGVRPGLSGLWQACGRSETTYAERVLMDMHYIDYRCLLLDIQLLILTAVAVLRRSGAC